MKEFIYQNRDGLIVIALNILLLLYVAWKNYQLNKFDSMWDGKPWDEAEYQKKVKEWEKEKESK